MTSVIRLSDAPHSISRIQLAQHWQKVLDDAILLSTRYVVQLSVSPDAFTNFMEILDGVEPHFSPEIFDDPMLLMGVRVQYPDGRFGFAKRDPQAGENRHDLLQEFDRKTEAQQSKPVSVMQSHTSGIVERPEGKLEIILLELEKMAQLLKQPRKKPASG